ncbi:MAG: PorT family protein [Bacteroidia bacterium]|nr:PorT family protein [Bacteroidia bacterium]
MIQSKVLISALILFVVSTVSVHAQKSNTFDLGLKAGVNFNKISSDGNTLPFEYETATSYLGGGFLRLNIGRFYLQPEGYFTGKRSEISVILQGADSTNTQLQDIVSVTSFDLPVLLGFKLINNPNFNARVYAGPVFTTVLDQKLGDLQVLNNSNYEFEKKNTGYQVGVGFDLGDLTIDGRYENSLTDWNNTYNQRIQLYQVSIGFKIF